MTDNKPQQVDPATYFRSLDIKELKAVHFDLLAEKQRIDHIYQMCISVIREKQHEEPTRVPAQAKDKSE